MMEKITCTPSSNFENIYIIEKVSCSPPGGPVSISKNFLIKNPVTFNCSPIATRNCDKEIFKALIDVQSKHRYFDAQINLDGRIPSLFIDDRRTLPQGKEHLRVGLAQLSLNNYKCKKTYR